MPSLNDIFYGPKKTKASPVAQVQNISPSGETAPVKKKAPAKNKKDAKNEE